MSSRKYGYRPRSSQLPSGRRGVHGQPPSGTVEPESQIIHRATVIDGTVGIAILNVVAGMTRGEEATIIGVAQKTAVAFGFLPETPIVGSFVVPLLLLDRLDPSSYSTLLVGGLLIVPAVVGTFAAGCAVPRSRCKKSVIGAGMIPRGEVGLHCAQTGLARGVFDSKVFSAATMRVVGTTLLAPRVFVLSSPRRSFPGLPRRRKASENRSQETKKVKATHLIIHHETSALLIVCVAAQAVDQDDLSARCRPELGRLVPALVSLATSKTPLNVPLSDRSKTQGFPPCPRRTRSGTRMRLSTRSTFAHSSTASGTAMATFRA